MKNVFPPNSFVLHFHIEYERAQFRDTHNKWSEWWMRKRDYVHMTALMENSRRVLKQKCVITMKASTKSCRDNFTRICTWVRWKKPRSFLPSFARSWYGKVMKLQSLNHFKNWNSVNFHRAEIISARKLKT